MKNCVYRFLNKNNEVIYIGKAKDLDRRLYSHNHLPKECYSERVDIEYVEFNSESEMDIAERYYIPKYKPKYNTVWVNNEMNINISEFEDKKWTSLWNRSKNNVVNRHIDKESVNKLFDKLDRIKNDIDVLRSLDKGNKLLDIIKDKRNEEEVVADEIFNIFRESYPNKEKWVIEEFIKNRVFAEDELIHNGIEEIKCRFLDVCRESIISNGYYKEEEFDRIDEQFCVSGLNNNNWKKLLPGRDNGEYSMVKYIIDEDVKNQIVDSIISDIQHNLECEFGQPTKEVIFIEGNHHPYKSFYTDYPFMKTNKPFVVYKFR